MQLQLPKLLGSSFCWSFYSLILNYLWIRKNIVGQSVGRLLNSLQLVPFFWEILSPQVVAAKVSLQYFKNLLLPFISCLAFWDCSVGEWSATNYSAIIRGRNLTHFVARKQRSERSKQFSSFILLIKTELELELGPLIPISVFLLQPAEQQDGLSLSNTHPSHHSFIQQMFFRAFICSSHWANKWLFWTAFWIFLLVFVLTSFIMAWYVWFSLCLLCVYRCT